MPKKPAITVKRAYEPPAETDGLRFLVDRLWPRGVKKEKLRLEGWLKSIAPSNRLRKWFGHDPERWPEFQKRYFAELNARRDGWKTLVDALKAGEHITLVFGARDIEHNNAVALKAYLTAKT
jgi:uncharacterized protein YeaO (DUF488 family)